jgi:hypothetical protein
LALKVKSIGAASDTTLEVVWKGDEFGISCCESDVLQGLEKSQKLRFKVDNGRKKKQTTDSHWFM